MWHHSHVVIGQKPSSEEGSIVICDSQRDIYDMICHDMIA
jgi:hypothetical protein